MHFSPITLESKQILQPYLDKEYYEISDIVFGNLWIWKHAREITYAISRAAMKKGLASLRTRQWRATGVRRPFARHTQMTNDKKG